MKLRFIKYLLIFSMVMCKGPIIRVETMGGNRLTEAAIEEFQVPELDQLFAAHEPQIVAEGELKHYMQGLCKDKHASFVTNSYDAQTRTYIFNAVLVTKELIITYFLNQPLGHDGHDLASIMFQFNWSQLCQRIRTSEGFEQDAFGFVNCTYRDFAMIAPSKLIDLIFNRCGILSRDHTRLLNKHESMEAAESMGQWISCKLEGDRLWLNVNECCLRRPSMDDRGEPLVHIGLHKKYVIVWTNQLGNIPSKGRVEYIIPAYSNHKLERMKAIANEHSVIKCDKGRSHNSFDTYCLSTSDAVEFMGRIDSFTHMSAVQVTFPEVETHASDVPAQVTCVRPGISGRRFPRIEINPYCPLPAFDGSALEFIQRFCRMSYL